MMTKSLNPNERESPCSCDFASKLVYRLGIKGALLACDDNQWRGIHQKIYRRYVGNTPQTGGKPNDQNFQNHL